MTARARMSPLYALVALSVSAAVIAAATWWLAIAPAGAAAILALTAWSLWNTRYSIEERRDGAEFTVRTGFRTHRTPLEGAHDFEHRPRIGLTEHLNGLSRRRAYARSFTDAVLFTDANDRRWIITPPLDFARALERKVGR